MAEPATTTTATPPATTGGINQEQINAAVAAAIGPLLKPLTESITALAKDQEIISSTLTQLPPAAAGQPPKPTTETPKPADAAKPLTLDELNKLLDQREQRHQQQSQVAEQRKGVIAAKLSKLPSVYADQLGQDPTKWDAEATAIQQRYEADLKAQGFKPVDVNPAAAGAGGQPAAKLPIALDKMTDRQVKAAAIESLPKIPGAAVPDPNAPTVTV